MAYIALMVFVRALFLLVTAFRTSHDDLVVVSICWVSTGTWQANFLCVCGAKSPVFVVFQVVEFGEMGTSTHTIYLDRKEVNMSFPWMMWEKLPHRCEKIYVSFIYVQGVDLVKTYFSGYLGPKENP